MYGLFLKKKIFEKKIEAMQMYGIFLTYMAVK